VYQEREATKQTRPIIIHTGPGDDLVLNTGQMRDAVDLQPFRVDSEPLDTETIIMASVLREFELKKAAAKAAVSAAAAGAEINDSMDGTVPAPVPQRGGRGRGQRGRGRPRGGRSRPGPQRLTELQAGPSSVG
jgi:hypothetical protein